MSRQFYPCPWKLCHALTVCLPIFQKLFRTLSRYRPRKRSKDILLVPKEALIGEHNLKPLITVHKESID